MSLPQMGSVEAGGYKASVMFPSPWPPVTPVALAMVEIEGGDVAISAEPTGALRCTVSRSHPLGETVYDVRSCALLGSPPTNAAVMVSWGRSELEIWLFGRIIGASSRSDLGPHVPVYFGRREAVPTREDFSEQNSQAILKRRDKLAGFQVIPQRPRGGRDHDYDLLRDELRQIRDLMAWVLDGKTYHAAGLANSLRKLIGKASFAPMPLLQRCAAADNKALIVYTSDQPKEPVPVRPDIMLRFSALPTPADRAANPVDLDVLLEFPVLAYESRTLSYREAIVKLGNTMGSHADSEIVPSTVILRGFRGTALGLLTDSVVHFLFCMGNVTEALASQLIGDAGR